MLFYSMRETVQTKFNNNCYLHFLHFLRWIINWKEKQNESIYFFFLFKILFGSCVTWYFRTTFEISLGTGPEPCLASYNWPFRITLLTFSVLCGLLTLALAVYMFQHRKVKVFKVASPIFLTITLLGCAIMYLEMAAIFPILDTYSCIGNLI